MIHPAAAAASSGAILLTLNTAGGVQSPPAVSLVGHFFAEEREALRIRLEQEPQFSPFRFLPDGMLTFLCGEKMRLSLASETRVVRGYNGDVLTGYGHHYDCRDDIYHPKQFEPFIVKGFWIPESEGLSFSILQPEESSPLIRKTPHGNEILFLVHPKSEELFAPLMQKYASAQINVPALSLSSFRTLLVALPNSHSLPQYAMVKVSLNESIGGALRVLSLKECAGSVATTAILHRKPSGIAFVEENFSFVPHPNLISPQFQTAHEKGAGIIHRPIPECLTSSGSNECVIPLFALFGTANRPLLDLLILQSRKTPTQFIADSLLTPLADAFIDLLYIHRVSIEAHGQNLLISINAADPQDLKIKLMYRDMGGVNCLVSAQEMETLPLMFRNSNFFYFNTHVKDAADVLEGIARKVLFNLTKQFFKSDSYERIDPQFARWKSVMLSKGYSDNWTLSGEDPDAHRQEFSAVNFYRYGYFEKIFGQMLLEAMSRKGIFIDIADYQPELNYSHFLNNLSQPEDPYNTCIEIEWFKDLILQTYPLYLSNT